MKGEGRKEKRERGEEKRKGERVSGVRSLIVTGLNGGIF